MQTPGLRRQLILALVVPAIVVIAAMAYFADYAAKRALDGALSDRLTAIAAAAATRLDERHLLLEPGEDDFRIARRARQDLAELATATGVEQILLISLETGDVLLDSSGALKIGDTYAREAFDRSELEQVKTGTRAASVLFQGPEGRWYKTGYAPLRDESGQPRAGVVVNAKAEFFGAIDLLQRTLFGIAILGLLALVTLATLAARTVTVPLSRLSEAAERIGKGDLRTEIPVGGPRETAVLSETMRAMASSISARDEEMQMMLAGIAHEVRNPLGGIELFGGLLREDLEETDPRRKHVEKILKEISVLAGVVNDFLDFARKRPLDRKRFDFAELVDDIVGIAAPVAQTAGIELEKRVESNLVTLMDRDAIKRALLNLVQNGIQATPQGGRVSIGAKRCSSGVEVTVEDTGPGIPKEKATEIFAPFYTTKQSGTGLGLALVKKSVEAHGGSIMVDDRPGGGARFLIVLPEPEAGADEKATPEDEPGLLF